jgi:hypothetical protein
LPANLDGGRHGELASQKLLDGGKSCDLDCEDSFINSYMYHNALNCILKIYMVYFLSFISNRFANYTHHICGILLLKEGSKYFYVWNY